MIFLKMFSRRWLLTTLFVFLGTALCIRLGIWQLDRLEQRRAFNAQVISMRAAPLLDLNAEQPSNIISMEWRPVTVTGEYDFENQLALRNQVYGDQVGYHLITPILFADGKAVLVDRGWIPTDGNSTPEDWRKYDVPNQVTITGQIRLGHGKPAFGGVADALPENGEMLKVWNNFDVERIVEMSPLPLLPVYVQPSADNTHTEPPIPYQPEVDLTEGSHFGYALQWFTFAAILFLGYPFYLRKQES
jgi:surfeit locus 1 family protein